MHSAFALAATIAFSSATASLATAPLTCFEASVYQGARTTLSELPNERQRAVMDDQALAASYGQLEIAGYDFLATEGEQKCEGAEKLYAHYREIRDIVVAAGGLDAGYCCSNWNTGTGGTGCTATTGNSCSGNLFYCEKKADGTCF